jgi:hypothetical protein
MKHHETPETPTTVRRGEVLEVWVSLLDLASQNTPRGSIEGADPQQIGWMLEMEPERVSAIISTLKEKGMIDGNSLTAWSKRQPKREREDYSTPRVRVHRNLSPQTDGTPCNAREHHETPWNTMKRHETPRGDRGDLPLDNPLHHQPMKEEHRERESTKEKEDIAREFYYKGKDSPLTPQTVSKSCEYPKTLAAIQAQDAAADDVFVRMLVQKISQDALSKDLPNVERITDAFIAGCVNESYRTGPKDHRAGLLLSRVPKIVITRLKEPVKKNGPTDAEIFREVH